MSELVSTQQVAPVVHSTANPAANLLLQMRAIITHDKTISDLFLRFRAEKLSIEWLRDQVATCIAPHITIECSFAEVVEASLYLADEYNQLGEGYFLVATETGRVSAVLSEDDFYYPASMSRHSGEQAEALRRIKPGTELAIVTYKYEKARDLQILATLKERYAITSLEEDPRLKIATRAGRKKIATDLETDDARKLLRGSGGTTGMFLRHFPLTDVASTDGGLQGTAAFRSVLGVQDPLAMNLHYNRLGALRGAAPQGWVRDICRTLTQEAHLRRRAIPTPLEDLVEADLANVDLWIADPNAYREMLRVYPAIRIVPVEGVSPVGLSGVMGSLYVPSDFTVESYERSGQWGIVANLPYTLTVAWDKLRILALLDVPQDGVV